MREIGWKEDDSTTSSGELTAEDFNAMATEEENIVKATDDIDPSDNSQTVKAIDTIAKYQLYVNTGSSNTIELHRPHMKENIDRLYDGIMVAFVATADNTGSTTVKLNQSVAKPLKRNGANLPAHTIKAKNLYFIKHESDEWSVVGEISSELSEELAGKADEHGDSGKDFNAKSIKVGSGTTTEIRSNQILLKGGDKYFLINMLDSEGDVYFTECDASGNAVTGASRLLYDVSQQRWEIDNNQIAGLKRFVFVNNENVWDSDISEENVFGDTAVGAGAAEMRGAITQYDKHNAMLQASLRFEISSFGDISPETDSGVSFKFNFLAFLKRAVDSDIVGFAVSPQGTAILWAATHNSDTDYSFHDKTGSNIRWTVDSSTGKIWFYGNDFHDLGISESGTFDAIVIDMNQIQLQLAY